MITAMIRIVVLGTFAAALFASPVLAAGGGGGGGGGGVSSTDPYAGAYSDQKAQPSYPKRSNPRATQKGKKPNSQSSIGDPAFAAGYRAAYDTIYERNDYAVAIEQLKALGHDDHPAVANLIGYSYRKLGDYKQSQIWYERALKADPNHVLTWQYYGLWQLEQGNREQAMFHLDRIAAICGRDCEEYKSLATALEKPTGAALVY
ncbi:tetratricopeptide repeat protein [Bradyrhizobium sp. 147]|uniref:tetratricopeptide repeat protein n=1 Tax=unclassified Bradyrhizobium TaxID=2631580 RepID=UPI001FF763E2|nr:MULTISPECIES: tetratricopeptide repeat protein [unclassified Bradyrhizobium]MCK1547406.1 tetratricopeptide repeat protein [Bradyrhizobium sp. 179]MCK1623968.1 tetratricopeptide repeat protein [Bradyrhizobium sp. 160]MCK1682282.1 tetratricopeptide repeat protein [Bradyrhizobium sp. 147]